ncbi:MAG: phospholipase effector Tle1 domain-containing protein [Gemmatimonadaceae bacterium]
MRKKQRLVLCLDGTWNNKDDSTNVLHHFALALNALVPSDDSTVTQQTYYDEGVGTGVVDGITGGAFGFGLEENVRQAYDWLVENFHDDAWEPDDIYVFGFSRGAFTARSLVGFISTFGLLRRGAPISVDQLWEEYCILGRARERGAGVWERIFGQPWTERRRINDLICDPWNIEPLEKKRPRSGQGAVVPGLLVDPGSLAPAERLLVTWSRRVRITFLGVYDTVGALGLDALAIPGLKSKMAMHHNMRPTSLIQNCRHASALDEHRSSFAPTPFLEFVGHGDEEDDRQLETFKDENPAEHWVKSHEKWRHRITQRWFVGAHSNIGGGYPDNEFAQLPLQWLLEGAKEAGLECEDIYAAPEMERLPLRQVLAGTAAPNEKPPAPKDSYTAFAKPFWTKIIRGKRYYRPIDPVPEVRASTKGIKGNDGKRETPPGFSLYSINEQIDPTVFAFAHAIPSYRPPNLLAYAKRKLAGNEPRVHAEPTPRPNEGELQAVASWRMAHDWLGESSSAHLVLVLWGTFAAIGLVAMHSLFNASDWSLSVWWLGLAALALALVDWGESRTNFAIAVGRTSAWRQALLDAIYWTRTIGFVLFACGAITAFVHLWAGGWYADSWSTAWDFAWPLINPNAEPVSARWWGVPVLAGVGVAAANVFDGAPWKRHLSGLKGVLGGVAAALVAVPAVVFTGRLLGQVFTPLVGHTPPSPGSPAAEATLAGELLLLQIALFYFLNSLAWVGAPMLRANLGSIFPLQRCATPGKVRTCLEDWRKKLECQWGGWVEDRAQGPAARAMRGAVRLAIWRDLIGFMPVYAAVLCYGLWFAARQLQWGFLEVTFAGIAVWLLLPIVAVVADAVEDVCHLRYLALHERGAEPSVALTLTSIVSTVIKFAAFIPAMALVVWALVKGTLRVSTLAHLTGWRGTVGLLISLLAALATLALLISVPIYRYRASKEKRAR